MSPGAVVVGTGFGCRVHVPALRAAGFDVIALVGTDPAKTARRAERLGIPHAHTSLADALERGGDAITIATPPDTHAELAIAVCEAGRSVLCEKPFALNGREAQAMVDAANRADVIALVGHEFRWAEDRATVGRAITAGAIGTPRVCSLVQYVPLVADPQARTPPWWFDPVRGGGWLGASGSHIIDQVRSWLGEFAAVSAALPLVSARRDVAEDSFVVRFTLANGVEGVLQQTAASWVPHPVGLTIVAGTEGTIESDGTEVVLSDRDGRRVLPVDDDLRLPALPPAAADPRERFTHLELGPYTRLCAALRGDPSAVPVPTFADGLACVRVMDAIRTSAARGSERVALDYQPAP